MKLKHGLILAAFLSATLPGQTQTTNTAPPLQPPPGTVTAEAPLTNPVTGQPPIAGAGDTTTLGATNKTGVKPAKKISKKKAATPKKKKPAAETKPEAPLAANEPAVAKQNNVNVRGKARINSEVVTHLKKGDTVTVLELVTLKKPKVDEPAKWAKIALPAGTHVWVDTAFLDATNKTVVPAKLNVRSGPGENYSVIGLMHKGDSVKDINTRGNWTEIEAPTNAFAFVAAHLLAKKEVTVPPATEATPTAPPVTSVVETPKAVAPPATETPVNTPPAVVTTPTATPIVSTPPPAVTPAVEETPTTRVVEREGIVRGTVSIQAPSYYELQSLDNGKVIDYLYTTSTNLVLKRWRGRTVFVTGEEGLDERWPNTPVLTVQEIRDAK